MERYFLPLFLIFGQFALAQIDPSQIQIARDSFGTPHIFASTDAEVAYGFAWATAEDDFETQQMQLLAVKGLMGQVRGKEGAFFDVAVHLLDPHSIVAQNYEKEVSEDFKKVLEAYAQGVNAYARTYPKKVLHKKLFPVGPKDVLKGYVVGLALLSGVDKPLTAILDEKVEAFRESESRGSNAFALSRKKTQDGKTYLAINSHQPLQGLNSWYEAHLCSEEGWNILGATFAGGASIFVGSNEHLGWAHTVNHPDLADIYELQMDPDDDMVYEIDGKKERLQPYYTKARIKLWGFIPISLKQKFYKSTYGVTMKTKEGVFALRFSANQTLKAAEQWYRMNKARTLEEFQQALAMQGIVSTNIVYADKEDNIYYISNGLFPKRDKGFNWASVLPGDTTATIWKEFYPYDSCAQVLNPGSGFVYNCNHTPFLSSGPKDNPDPQKVPATMGYQNLNDLTNRGVKLGSMLNKSQKVSWEEFLRMKYDQSYEIPSPVYPKLNPLFTVKPEAYPKLAESLRLLQAWDGKADVSSVAAPLFIITIYHLLNDVLEDRKSLEEGEELTEAKLMQALAWTQDYLIKHFQSSKVMLGQVQLHSRGKKRLPYGGGPDVLAAVASRFRKDGTLVPWAGDSYIQLVRFNEEGPEIFSINAYGASADPKSPHYNDQMDMFVKQQLRKMTLDKEKVLKEAVRTYHPR